MNRTNHVPTPRNPNLAWRVLYIAGGVAALVAVVIFRRNFGTELLTFNGFGIFTVPDTGPISASDWFTLLQANQIIGLILFDLFDLVNYALVGLIFLALYGVLRNTNKSLIVIATAFGFTGIAVYFASYQAFSMLNLSERYAAATTDAQRAMFLSAGEALLAIQNPGTIFQGTGIYMSYFLVIIAGLLISIVMVRSTVFNRATAYVGILANGFALVYFIFLPLALSIIWLPHTISAPFRIIWYILIAIRLFQLGRATHGNEEKT